MIKADITINKNMVPFDSRSPFVTSGIRIGTAAITTRGMKEADCVQIVDWMDQVVQKITNEDVLSSIKHDVNAFMEGFPLYEE